MRMGAAKKSSENLGEILGEYLQLIKPHNGRVAGNDGGEMSIMTMSAEFAHFKSLFRLQTCLVREQQDRLRQQGFRISYLENENRELRQRLDEFEDNIPKRYDESRNSPAERNSRRRSDKDSSLSPIKKRLFSNFLDPSLPVLTPAINTIAKTGCSEWTSSDEDEREEINDEISPNLSQYDTAITLIKSSDSPSTSIDPLLSPPKAESSKESKKYFFSDFSSRKEISEKFLSPKIDEVKIKQEIIEVDGCESANDGSISTLSNTSSPVASTSKAVKIIEVSDHDIEELPEGTLTSFLKRSFPLEEDELEENADEDLEEPYGGYTKQMIVFENEEENCLTTNEPYYVHVPTNDAPCLEEEDCLANANTLSNVEVPSFRYAKYGKLQTDSETEEIDDEAYSRRHNKPEIDERRRKRWDSQRQRDESYKLRIKENQEARQQNKGKRKGKKSKWKKKEKSGNFSDDESSLLPRPENALYIRVKPDIPIMAFGHTLPLLGKSEFKLPWDTDDSDYYMEESFENSEKDYEDSEQGSEEMYVQEYSDDKNSGSGEECDAEEGKEEEDEESDEGDEENSSDYYEMTSDEEEESGEESQMPLTSDVANKSPARVQSSNHAKGPIN